MIKLGFSTLVGFLVQAESELQGYSPEISASSGVAAAGITNLCLTKLSQSTKKLMSLLGMTLILNQGVYASQLSDQNELACKVSDFANPQLVKKPEFLPFAEPFCEKVEIDDFIETYGDEILQVYKMVKNGDASEIKSMPHWENLGYGMSKRVLIHDQLPGYVLKIEYSDYRKGGLVITARNSRDLERYKELNGLDLLKVPKMILVNEIGGYPVDIIIEERVDIPNVHLSKNEELQHKKLGQELSNFGLCDLHRYNFNKIEGEEKFSVVDLDCSHYSSSKLSENDTTLYRAVVLSDFEKVKGLLIQGANIHALDGAKRTPISYAQNQEIIKFLINNGANITLEDALSVSNFELARFLIGQGEGVEAKITDGETLLIKSVLANDFEMSKFLIEQGADVNAKSEDGEPVLTRAISERNFEIAQFLIENGADIDATNEFGDTALMKSIIFERTKVSNFLLELGADINTKNNYGETAVIYAVSAGNLEMLQYLVEKGADLSCEDEEGNTALSLALEYERSDMVRLLTKGE